MADLPTAPGWFVWRWPRGQREQSVQVYLRDDVLWAGFGVPMPLADVATWYPGSEWHPARECEPVRVENFD